MNTNGVFAGETPVDYMIENDPNGLASARKRTASRSGKAIIKKRLQPKPTHLNDSSNYLRLTDGNQPLLLTRGNY